MLPRVPLTPIATFCCDTDGFPVPTVTPDIDALLEEVKLLIVPAVKLHDVPSENDPVYVPPVKTPVSVLAVNVWIVPAVRLLAVPIDPVNVPVLEMINPEYVPTVRSVANVPALNV